MHIWKHSVELLCLLAASFFCVGCAASTDMVATAVVHQDIGIDSIAGSKCRLIRDGKVLADVLLPNRGDESITKAVVHVDMAGPRNPISVTCSKDGYKSKATIVSTSPSYGNYLGHPCRTPDYDRVRNEYPPGKKPGPTDELCVAYPFIVRLILEKTDK